MASDLLLPFALIAACNRRGALQWQGGVAVETLVQQCRNMVFDIFSGWYCGDEEEIVQVRNVNIAACVIALLFLLSLHLTRKLSRKKAFWISTLRRVLAFPFLVTLMPWGVTHWHSGSFAIYLSIPVLFVIVGVDTWYGASWIDEYTIKKTDVLNLVNSMVDLLLLFVACAIGHPESTTILTSRIGFEAALNIVFLLHVVTVALRLYYLEHAVGKLGLPAPRHDRKTTIISISTLLFFELLGWVGVNLLINGTDPAHESSAPTVAFLVMWMLIYPLVQMGTGLWARRKLKREGYFDHFKRRMSSFRLSSFGHLPYAPFEESGLDDDPDVRVSQSSPPPPPKPSKGKKGNNLNSRHDLLESPTVNNKHNLLEMTSNDDASDQFAKQMDNAMGNFLDRH